MFEELEKINTRPKPFEFYTADDLWTDEYTSRKMLVYHLNKEIDVASRNMAFISKSIDWIVSQFNVSKGTKIADFGCGPGLYTNELARRQADVTGIDFSARSIEYARENAVIEALSINYVNQNYLEFETEDRFDLIMMIMCDFCALSPVQRKKLLVKFGSLLKPDGCILLDVYSLKAFEQRQETSIYRENLLDGFWSDNKYYGFLNTFKYEDEKVVLDKYTIIETNRRRTIYNWLQYYSVEALKQEFRECGLTINEFYSDVAGMPYNSQGQEFAIVAGNR